eukprot:ctg_218.g146
MTTVDECCNRSGRSCSGGLESSNRGTGAVRLSGWTAVGASLPLAVEAVEAGAARWSGSSSVTMRSD